MKTYQSDEDNPRYAYFEAISGNQLKYEKLRTEKEVKLCNTKIQMEI